MPDVHNPWERVCQDGFVKPTTTRIGARMKRQSASSAVVDKYPAPGDIYSSRLDRGEPCKVISIINDHVTYQWLRGDTDNDVHTTPMKQFIRYFRLRMYAVE